MTVASEAGSGYIEFDDHTRKLCNHYETEHPNATFEEVYRLFFENYANPVSGKIISPRHFDAAGCMTFQILIEGRYNDILEPFLHFYPLRRDISNAAEVIDFMRDAKAQQRIAEAALEHVLGRHTYTHRVAEFEANVTGALKSP
jgi:spore maturation protein CgeB